MCAPPLGPQPGCGVHLLQKGLHCTACSYFKVVRFKWGMYPFAVHVFPRTSFPAPPASGVRPEGLPVNLPGARAGDAWGPRGLGLRRSPSWDTPHTTKM